MEKEEKSNEKGEKAATINWSGIARSECAVSVVRLIEGIFLITSSQTD